MHLEVTASATLAALDRFLRDIWLECCGHLSAFEIGGVRYAIDAGVDDEWHMGEKSMRVRLDKVLSPGQTCFYEYDYGTTTELRLKVISEREVEAKGKAIQVLARNTPPMILCEVCGKPAIRVCAQCIYDDRGWVCNACAKDHECGEEMLLPVVNSPRVGMCCIFTSCLVIEMMASGVSFGRNNATKMKLISCVCRKYFDLPLLQR